MPCILSKLKKQTEPHMPAYRRTFVVPTTPAISEGIVCTALVKRQDHIHPHIKLFVVARRIRHSHRRKAGVQLHGFRKEHNAFKAIQL